MMKDKIEGFEYHENCFTADVEQELLRELRSPQYNFEPYRGRGTRSNWLTLSYGKRFVRSNQPLEEAGAIPGELWKWRDLAAEKAGVDPEELKQLTINCYPEGFEQRLPHRDSRLFGAPIIGVSLGVVCRLKFTPTQGGEDSPKVRIINPRSIYCMSGLARFQFNHSVLSHGQNGVRYSLIFRPLPQQ